MSVTILNRPSNASHEPPVYPGGTNKADLLGLKMAKSLARNERETNRKIKKKKLRRIKKRKKRSCPFPREKGNRQLFRGLVWRVSSLDWTRRRIGTIRGSDSNIQNSKTLTWPTERKWTPMEIYKWWRSSLSAASRCCTGHYYPPAAPICCQPSRDLPVRGYKPRHNKHRLGSCYHSLIWGRFPKRLERPAGSLLPLTLNLPSGGWAAKSDPTQGTWRSRLGIPPFSFL